MLAGYTENQPIDRMINLTTNSITHSRDIIWLNKTYNEWNNSKTTIPEYEEQTIELPTGIEKTKLGKNSTKDTEDSAMKKLESWFNLQATRAVEAYNYGREIKLDKVNLTLFSMYFIKEPSTYEEALNRERREYQMKWK
jgi:hypothetical protein